jgi:tRNA pseudouridine32 synthase/23S rRNA pseudouridine746 synthase
VSNKYISSSLFTLVDQQTDFIVVNKHAGVSFHDEGEINTGLFNSVKQQLQLAELYPVHRLDKMTSGLVIMAKNLATTQQFQQLFSKHQLEKFYLALSDQRPKKKQGLIKGDMGKSRRGSYKLLRSQNNPAITQFFSYSIANSLRLFIIKLHSGKTHQIRVALNSIGSPIMGDSSYYAHSPADRGYLHAYALRFSLNEHAYEYVCLPDQGELFVQADCQDAIEQLSPPWQLNWPKV